jgi:hypothetical protein
LPLTGFTPAAAQLGERPAFELTVVETSRRGVPVDAPSALQQTEKDRNANALADATGHTLGKILQ